MKIKSIFLGSVIALSLISCDNQTNSICDNKANIDGVKWYYESDEKIALYLEVYNLSAERIKQQVKDQKLQKDQWGIILDIDETVLDNSWTEYENYKNYKFDEKVFKEAKATALPGAKMLTHLVHDLGGYVSFITNRNGSDKEIFDATVKNMQNEGVYYDQIILSNADDEVPYNKNPRFIAVESGVYSDKVLATNKLPAHEIVAYFGDNIQDFPNMTQKNMKAENDSAYANFGIKYFILPNPMYGSWQ